MIEFAVSKAKEKFQTMNKKQDTKKINCYLTLGGDSFNNAFWAGSIATLLWLEDYIDVAKDAFNIKPDEIETAKNVLARMELPKITDITVKGTDIKTVSNCRHYASFLFAIAHWCTSGMNKIKTSGGAHTNMDVVRLLTATAMNHFPSIPFSAYFIGQIKCNDIFNAAEEMGKCINFNEYMSPESIMLNQPQFIIQTDNAPIVGVVGHPLVNSAICQKSANGRLEWLGMFEANDEFEKICIQNGFTSQEVKKYLLMINKEKHEQNVAKKNKIALFVETQHLAKQALELHSSQLVGQTSQ